MESGNDALKNKVNYAHLLIILILVLCSFLFIYKFIYPVKYDELSGSDSWLSGSSLKFVNQWLEEGALTHHFTYYESFDSIEFTTLEERTPYLSYPTGNIFMVYMAAKLLGREHIDISFLKHYGMALYMLDTLLFAVFIYAFLSHFGGISYRSRLIITYIAPLMWILMPANTWYLSNIYWADQAVILFVMLFLLLEYINNEKTNILKILTIYCGIMTDYYFWIIAFGAFALFCLRSIMLKKNIKYMLKGALSYICPVIAALMTFYWQLSYTDNWIEYLLDKYSGRSGDYSDLMGIWDNLRKCFADFSFTRLDIIVGVEVIMLIMLAYYLTSSKKWKNVIINNEYSILLLGFTAPVAQLLILKNHSASHDYSMVKVSWILDMSVLILAFLTAKLLCRSYKHFVLNYLGVLFITMIIMNFPHNISDLLSYYHEDRTYTLENILYDISEYEDVYFSFTYDIPLNPPQQLAVSEKQVHQISSLEEIRQLFPDMPENARKQLVIDKLLADKDAGIAEQEKELSDRCKVVYEDDIYCIILLE